MIARLILATAAAVLALLTATPGSRASSEGGCYPQFPTLSSKFMCRDVLATLNPENDTRDNLIFLMADRQRQMLRAWPQPAANDGSGGYYGMGTVCVSDGSGGVGFQAALASDATIPVEEKKLLGDARLALSCEGNSAAPAVAVQSPAGKAFADYLAATDQFYRSSHTDPTRFDALANSSHPWVREAARYMQARIALLAAQAMAFDDWGTLDRARMDLAMVAKARDGLNAYLAEYPAGSYATSAKGLLRRADWFAGDPKVLAATYSKFVATSGVDRSTVNLVTEIDQKLPLESYTDPTSDPMLLAVQLLRLMRQDSVGSDTMAYQMKPDVLEAHRGHFVGQEALFDYLSALRTFLVDKDADSVLRLVSDAAPSGPMDYLTFSRQMLRAAALDAKGDGAARELYLSLLPHAESVYQRGTVEMALAKYEVQHKNVSFLFEDGSPIQNPDIRIRLLDDVAGPIILKMQATSQAVPQAERDAALYRLLMRDLTQGRFKGFLSDVKLLPPTPDQTDDSENVRDFSIFRWEGDKESGYDCPGIVEIAKTLAANSKDVKGRLCLGDFYRLHYIDPGEFTPPEESFGGRGTLFAGEVLLREDFYKDIMKDPKARRIDRAYALYRAVHCYQGTNTCGGDSDKSVRKGWYNKLKARYGDTVWAKSLRYYW